jgi:hypothetical protein
VALRAPVSSPLTSLRRSARHHLDDHFERAVSYLANHVVLGSNEDP